MKNKKVSIWRRAVKYIEREWEFFKIRKMIKKAERELKVR